MIEVGMSYRGLIVDASFRVIAVNGKDCTIENTSSGDKFDIDTKYVETRITSQKNGMMGA